VNTVHFLTIPASITPEREIMVFEGRRQTYQETTERVNRLANAFAALGIAKGDRIAVLDTNSPRYVETYYAASRLGAVFVPLNYRVTADELVDMVTTANARALLVGDRYVPLVAQVRERLLCVAEYVAFEAPQASMLPFEELLAGGASEEIEAEVEEEDLNTLLYTSGTTGRPKGVMLTYGDFVAYICGNTELTDGTPRGSALICVPLYHIAGITTMMTSFFTGRTLVILRQFDPQAWLQTVQRERITHAFVVPTMLKRLLDAPEFAGDDLSSLEVLAYGAAPMPLPVIRQAIERFPPTVGFINAFGQTETTATVTKDGKITIQIPSDIEPGEHEVVVIIEERLVKRETRPPLDLPVRDYGPWPGNLSLRREDMYNEWGR